MRAVVGDTEAMRSAFFVLAFVGLAGCTTYRDQLGRGERAFEQNDNDRALAILRDLEPSFSHLTPTEQASYAYIRGMIDYNVGYKADARHWLSVANAYEQVTPGALAGDRKTKTTQALKELNEIVHTKGIGELVNGAPAAASSAAPASSSAPSEKKTDKKKKPKPADESDNE
jgi:hypothetical protein